MKYTYIPQGVCSKQINIDIEDGIIDQVEFVGGCDGNAKGLAALAKGCKPEEVAHRLEGITCGQKCTSCPAQLSKALYTWMKEQKQA